MVAGSFGCFCRADPVVYPVIFFTTESVVQQNQNHLHPLFPGRAVRLIFNVLRFQAYLIAPVPGWTFSLRCLSFLDRLDCRLYLLLFGAATRSLYHPCKLGRITKRKEGCSITRMIEQKDCHSSLRSASESTIFQMPPLSAWQVRVVTIAIIHLKPQSKIVALRKKK